MISCRPQALTRLCPGLNRWFSYLPSFVALSLLSPVVARAQLYDMPYADVSYQENSNIFALPFDAISTRTLEERGGIDALYNWSQQEFYVNGEARHFSYSGLSDLDHSEYLVHGGMKWRVLSLFDGVLDYRRERSMVNFLDFQAAGTAGGTALFLQNDTVGTASINIQFTPDWRLQSEGQVHKLDSPRPGFPDLSLTEDSIHEGIRYLGVAKLSAGIDGIYLKGHFDNDEFVGSPRYNEKTIEAAAEYVATGLSTFNGAAGYTRRDQGSAGSVGGTTGSLAYTRYLTGKTLVNLKVYRAVNSYVTYGGSEIDTGVNLGAIWNATGKLAVTPGYNWVHSSFPGAVQPGTSERADHYQLASIQIKYQMREWLSIRPYGQYETRRSNLEDVTFNRTMYGVELEVRLPRDADKAYEINRPGQYQ